MSTVGMECILRNLRFLCCLGHEDYTFAYDKPGKKLIPGTYGEGQEGRISEKKGVS